MKNERRSTPPKREPNSSEKSTNHFSQQIGKFYRVENYDHNHVLKISNISHVFMCWPPMQDWTAEIVKNIKRGSYLFLIAEGYGGCCGTDEMFDYLNKKFELVDTCQIPQWFGIHDYLQIYKRK